MNFYNNRMSHLSRRGFTLIELVVVIMIIAILAAIGTPQYFKVLERARAVEAYALLISFRSAQERMLARNGRYAHTNIDVAGFDISMRSEPPTFGMKYFFLVLGSGNGAGCQKGNPYYNMAFVRIDANAGVSSRYYKNYMMVYELCTNDVTFPGCPNCVTDFQG